MLVAAEKIKDRCKESGIHVTVKIQNLWETTYVVPGSDLIVEMFPFFGDEPCPVLSGKPFINHIGEEELLEEILQLLGTE